MYIRYKPVLKSLPGRNVFRVPLNKSKLRIALIKMSFEKFEKEKTFQKMLRKIQENYL